MALIIMGMKSSMALRHGLKQVQEADCTPDVIKKAEEMA
jgi:hypothetical protein